MTEFVERQVGDRTLRVCLACAVNEHEQHDATVCTDCAICLSLARFPDNPKAAPPAEASGA